MSVSLLHPELSHFDLSIQINQSIPISTISRHAIELNWKLLDVLLVLFVDLHWNWNQPTTHNPPCCLENSALPGKIVRTCHIKFLSAMLIPSDFRPSRIINCMFPCRCPQLDKISGLERTITNFRSKLLLLLINFASSFKGYE